MKLTSGYHKRHHFKSKSVYVYNNSNNILFHGVDVLLFRHNDAIKQQQQQCDIFDIKHGEKIKYNRAVTRITECVNFF